MVGGCPVSSGRAQGLESESSHSSTFAGDGDGHVAHVPECAWFFDAHRDNLSPNTAHRRLAVSVNLNEGYSGGELRFPEFGLDRYCPKLGNALVFSCAHLHEVLPVTNGRRFTLLTFLYDETAKRQDVVDPFAV